MVAHRLHADDGLTLIETVVTLIVAAVFASVIVPSVTAALARSDQADITQTMTLVDLEILRVAAETGTGELPPDTSDIVNEMAIPGYEVTNNGIVSGDGLEISVRRIDPTTTVSTTVTSANADVRCIYLITRIDAQPSWGISAAGQPNCQTNTTAVRSGGVGGTIVDETTVTGTASDPSILQ